MDAGGVDILAPDIQKVGGLAETRRIAALGDVHSRPLAPHNIAGPIGTLASAHVCASISNFLALEWHAASVPFFDELLVGGAPLIVDGYVELTDAPGIGADLDVEVARRYARPGELVLRRAPRRLAVADHGRAPDARVGEHVALVDARGRELGDDRSFVARLEPVQHVRRDRVLLARSKLDLVPHGERVASRQRRLACRTRRRLTFDVEVDDPGAAPERLLLAGRALEGWMPVLGAGLAREEHELLRADALRVDVDDDLETDLVEAGEAEVRHLDARELVRSEDDPGPGESRGRPLSRSLDLVPREHGADVTPNLGAGARPCVDGSTIHAP